MIQHDNCTGRTLHWLVGAGHVFNECGVVFKGLMIGGACGVVFKGLMVGGTCGVVFKGLMVGGACGVVFKGLMIGGACGVVFNGLMIGGACANDQFHEYDYGLPYLELRNVSGGQ